VRNIIPLAIISLTLDSQIDLIAGNIAKVLWCSLETAIRIITHLFPSYRHKMFDLVQVADS